jgi:hypothetical protein
LSPVVCSGDPALTQENVMTEEESSSVFGGLVDAAESAWDAQVNVAGAVVDASIGMSEFGVGVAEHLAATGAELLGQEDARDSLDTMAVDQRDAAYDSWSSAGEQVDNAYTDVVGE